MPSSVAKGVVETRVSDSLELTEVMKTLADAIAREECQSVTQLIVRRAQHLAENAVWRIREQSRCIRTLERDAITDSLTGALNRRGFEQELSRTVAQSKRYGETGALIFIDLDKFKETNDTYGHGAGDAVLQKVASILGNGVRESDRVARLGGDEFAVLMPRTTATNVQCRADTLEWRLNNAAIQWSEETISIHASLGTQSFGPRDEEKGIVHRADQAMYQIKRRRHENPVIVPTLRQVRQMAAPNSPTPYPTTSSQTHPSLSTDGEGDFLPANNA